MKLFKNSAWRRRIEIIGVNLKEIITLGSLNFPYFAFKIKNMSDAKIRCPKCQWQPAAHSRWGCTCGHTWNTFDTGGQCPSCGKQWENTQCLSLPCNQWSLHVDWYEELNDAIVELIESIEEPVTLE